MATLGTFSHSYPVFRESMVTWFNEKLWVKSKLLGETRFPHSIGLLYSAFTAFLGFWVNNGAYKVMGMTPYL